MPLKNARKVPEDRNQLYYILAKLEEIQEDVQELKKHVDLLRQESAERRVMWRVLLAAAGALGALSYGLAAKILSITGG